MATEKDLELLDNYLSNQLEEIEKQAFEQKLESDPSLQSELNLQQQIIEGIRTARMAELKSMLNQTVIPGSSLSSVLGKASLYFAITAVVGAGIYYLLDSSDTNTDKNNTTVTVEKPADNETITAEESIASDVKPVESEDISKETDKNRKPADDVTTKSNKKTDKKVSSTPIAEPTVEPFDPTKEMDVVDSKPEISQGTGESERKTTSTIQVEIDDTNRKQDFHYQFEDGKLILYGAFNKDLYEILEFFNGGKRTVFLYYNASFYLLDEAQDKPTQLKPITDQSLIQKLKDYRKN